MDPRSSSIHRRRSDDATRPSNSRTNPGFNRHPRLHHSTSDGGNTLSQDRTRLASSIQPNPAASPRRTGSGQGETWTDFLRSTAATSDGARYMNGTYGRANTVRSPYSTGAPQAGRHTSAGGSAQSTSRKRLLSEGATTTRREPPGPSATSTSRRPPAGGSGRSMDDPVNLESPTPPRRQVIFPRRTSDNRRDGHADIALPPWQRDEESLCCPVCHTAFSWYFRKHHCRKCGRVVCANCSLHRIAIPRKYIVQPPPVVPRTALEQQQQQRVGLVPATEQISPDVSQNVRVCNPCVPDPNLNPPPQQQTQSDGRSHAFSSNQTHYRHASSTYPSATANPINEPTSLLEAARRMTNVASPVASSRDRSISDSVTNASHQPLPGGIPSAGPWPGWSVHHRNQHYPNRNSTSHQTPGANDPGASFRAEWQRRRQALYNDYTQPSRSSNPTQISHPVVDEADQCPICLRALPPVDSTTGSDELRTAHIVRCITRAERRHSGASTGQSPTARRSVVEPSNSGTSASSRTTDPSPLYPGSAGRTASLNSRPLPPTPTADSEGDDDDDADEDPSPPTRMMQDMLRFRASAADCVNNEEKGGSAPECIICFEEFEEGQVLGRLGCLCRFHAVSPSCELSMQDLDCAECYRLMAQVADEGS